MVKRALISVSDKTGVVELAGKLVQLGFEIVSTGGTAKTLRESGITVTYISDVTGFPEILEGRVKTLHPKVHGGILAKRTPEHLAQLKENEITPIDLVVVNLYPFRQTVAKEGVTLEEAIENIDIGGPAMVRASAKNYQDVAIVVNPDRYGEVLKQLQASGQISLDSRFQLALEAFSHTAQYDSAIAAYLKGVAAEKKADPSETTADLFPEVFTYEGVKLQTLRYGENPHQQAGFYKLLGTVGSAGTGIAAAKQLQGKELSYNNILDANAALELVKEFKEPAAVIIKHNNPCGVSESENLLIAYQKAFACDPVSAFGGIVAVNREITGEVAREITKIFLEAIIAPGFTEEAIAVLAEKENMRLLAVSDFERITSLSLEVKSVGGGFLVQESDKGMVTAEQLQVVTEAKPDRQLINELLFAWKVVKHVKSNAIVVTKEGRTVGVGAGQMNRVGSAKIALEQAGKEAIGAVMSSDAFLPFSDTVDQAHQAGVKAIIQPGGSLRDQESIDKANAYGMVMVFTGQRHFKH